MIRDTYLLTATGAIILVAVVIILSRPVAAPVPASSDRRSTLHEQQVEAAGATSVALLSGIATGVVPPTATPTETPRPTATPRPGSPVPMCQHGLDDGRLCILIPATPTPRPPTPTPGPCPGSTDIPLLCYWYHTPTGDD